MLRLTTQCTQCTTAFLNVPALLFLLLLLPLNTCVNNTTTHRNGHSESRRSRRLVISFIATVVNYEYAMYWYLYQVGQDANICCKPC